MQQLQRGGVRPLEVLEHEQHRLLRGEADQELAKVPEQTRLELRRVGTGVGARAVAFGTQAREKLAQLGGPAAGKHSEVRGFHRPQNRHERVSEYRVGNAGLDRIRATDGDGEPGLLRAVGNGFDEPRLADAALARHEYRAGPPLRGSGQQRG